MTALLFTNGKHSQQLPIFPKMDNPGNLSQDHTLQSLERLEKTPKVVHLRLYRPQLGRQMLKLVMDLALTRMACLEGLPRKNQNTRLLEQ